MMYPKYGVNLYGNAIIVSEQFLKEKPEAVKAFLRAFTKGMKDVLADPDGVDQVREGARRAGRRDAREAAHEARASTASIATPEAKADGLGDVTPARLADMVTQVSHGVRGQESGKPRGDLQRRYLPPKADRMVFAEVTRTRVTQAVPRWTAPRAPFVEFRDVALAYDGQAGFAVEDISLSIAPGEFVAIVGPSGCGKSTFMKLATGLKPPTHGDGRRRGRARHGAAQDRRHGVPGADAAAVAHDARQRAAAARDRRAVPLARSSATARSSPSVRASCCARSASTATPTSSRGSSPAACSSARRSAARSCTSPRCCCSTSRSARSTRSRARSCGACCATCGPSTASP